MLKAMLGEMNRYGDSHSEVLKILNTRPENDDDSNFQVQVFKDGKRLEKVQLNHGGDERNRNLIDMQIEICSEVGPEENRYEYLKFTKQHLNRIDVDEGEYVFANSENERLILKRPARQKKSNTSTHSSSDTACRSVRARTRGGKKGGQVNHC